MANLWTLPVELFTQIVEDFDESTFLSLCVCSRILNSLATPYVYHHVILKTMQALHRFTITMIEKPMLDSFVKCFEFHPDLSMSGVDRQPTGDSNVAEHHGNTDQVVIDSRLLDAIRTRCRSTRQVDKRVWDLTEGSKRDTLLELLLPALRNVEHIDALPKTVIGWRPLRWMGLNSKEPMLQVQKLFRNLTSIGGLAKTKAGNFGKSFGLTEAEMILPYSVPSPFLRLRSYF